MKAFWTVRPKIGDGLTLETGIRPDLPDGVTRNSIELSATGWMLCNARCEDALYDSLVAGGMIVICDIDIATGEMVDVPWANNVRNKVKAFVSNTFGLTMPDNVQSGADLIEWALPLIAGLDVSTPHKDKKWRV